MSTVAVAYMVYKLLCLNDPARYYGKPSGDAIDIMNVAINAQQARNVFFKGFKTKIEKSPWFKGKFNAKMDSIEFDKSITVYSGHSERESHEGLNLFAAVLDEISGFALESNTGNAQGKTAGAIYKAFRGTVDSRFPDLGVVVLLSFPRFKEDYISQKYEEAILHKETKIRTHRFKVDNEMPDGVEGNEFDIEWEEDHIVHYRMPGVLALKRPTWEVNPTRNIEDFKHAFYTDAQDALMRFACMPPDAVSGYFSDHEKIDHAFSLRPPISEGMGFQEWFVPDKEKLYFMHADLAQSHDRAAVAMAHVGHWKHTSTVSGYNYYSPHIVVDFVQWWTPTKQRHIDLDEVRDFIVSIRRRGFNVRLVTFDRWRSVDMIAELNNMGINAERLSVATTHYDDLKLAIMEDRVSGPETELLLKELKGLQLMKGKVDHPRSKTGKDLSDAVTGAAYNAMTHTPRDTNNVEIVSLKDIQRSQQQELPNNIIKAPSDVKMPKSLADYLGGMRTI